MKNLFHMTWCLLLAGSFCQRTNDNYGESFIVAFSGGPRELRRAALDIIAQKSNTVITLTFGAQKRRVKINDRFLHLPMLSLLPKAGPPFPRQPRKAMYISSSSPVVVYKVWGLSRSMCIPVQSLSTKYTVANYLPSVDCKSHFSVIAKETGTKINIKFRIAKNGRCGKFVSGNEVTIPLFSLDVFPVHCNYDMTGTRITSNKPIAVIVGSECHKGLSKQTHAWMMLLPHNIHGTSFVLNSNTDVGSVYRVVSPYVQAKLESSDGRTWKIGQKKPLDIELEPGKPVCLTSSRTVQVIGGPRTRTLLRGTRILNNQVPSTGQFLQKYNIHAHVKFGGGMKRRGGMKYVVQAIVQKDVAHLLVASLRKLVKTQIKLKPVDSCEFVIVSASLTFNGLISVRSPVPFGLYIYEHGRRSKFGILPGTLLDITNCPTHDGFLYFANNDWCLRFERKAYSRREARKMCHRSKGHLVDVTSNLKHKVIRNIYGNGRYDNCKRNVTSLSPDATVYTGGFRYQHYNNMTRVWLWSDCSPMKHGQWNKGRQPWKCMTLQGSEMTLTQTDCHTKGSSICEFDVSHVQKHGHILPVPVRKSCRQKRRGHKRGKKWQNLSSRGVMETTSRSQTSAAFSTVTPSQSSATASVQGNLKRSDDPTTTHHTKGTVVSDESTPAQQTAEDTTLGSSFPRSTEPEYEEYEIRDEYDEPQTNIDNEDYVDYVALNGSDDISVTSNRSAEPITVATANTPQKVDRLLTNTSPPSGTKHDHDTETAEQYTITTTQPRIRKLNMTLVMEAYMKHTNNSKAILAARAHILALAKKVKQRCHCFCKSQRLQNTSQEAVTEHKEKVKKELGVKKSTLRKTLSKRMSADDNRPSAAVVGCIGFLFLLLPFAIIVLSDINTLFVRHRKRIPKEENADIYVNRSNDSLTANSDKY